MLFTTIEFNNLREKAVELCIKNKGRFDKEVAEEIYQFLKQQPKDPKEPPAITANDFRVPASQVCGQEPTIFVRESLINEGSSEKPNTHEAIAPNVYEAGFWFTGKRQFLRLPDGTELYLASGGYWKKNEATDEQKPHTFTPVTHHTVGKFYLLKDVDEENLSQYWAYALCLGNEFVVAYRPGETIQTYCAKPDDVTFFEVTPLEF